ncbi:hypothetical protein H8959_011864 [Pygathrix nigripes]
MLRFWSSGTRFLLRVFVCMPLQGSRRSRRRMFPSRSPKSSGPPLSWGCSSTGTEFELSPFSRVLTSRRNWTPMIRRNRVPSARPPGASRHRLAPPGRQDSRESPGLLGPPGPGLPPARVPACPWVKAATGTPVSPPRPTPPNVGLLGKKFDRDSGTPSAAPRPARRLLLLLCSLLPPGARAGRCAGGGPRSGRGAAGPEAEAALHLAPRDHIQSAGAQEPG